MVADLLFLTWNRAEFTEVACQHLEENTNWGRIRKLVVYDDGSEPEQLERIVRAIPATQRIRVPVDFRHTPRLGPPGVMQHYLDRDPAETFVKIDNDIAVPEGWLDDLMSAWDDEVELLGMEIGMPHGLRVEFPLVENGKTWVPSRHIGGVGMMRTSAFLNRPRMRPDGRFGFTEWQHSWTPKRGWIFPEINAPCLDRLPIEPFVRWSEKYERRGWQRPWWKYPLEADRFWNWMKGEVPA